MNDLFSILLFFLREKNLWPLLALRCRRSLCVSASLRDDSALIGVEAALALIERR